MVCVTTGDFRPLSCYISETVQTRDIVVSQWLSGNMPDCGVRGPRFESHYGQLCLSVITAIYSLGHGLHTLTAVPRSTQRSTLRGTVNSSISSQAGSPVRDYGTDGQLFRTDVSVNFKVT